MIKALVVDDDQTIRMIIRRILVESLGWSVIEAGNGEEGLEQYKKGAPDIALIDLEMPGMDGRELYLRLRKAYKSELVPVVVVTGINDKERIVSLIKSGVSEIILKPFDKVKMVARLKEIVKK